ncbi:MAG: Peptidase M23 [Candidatus Moranbacteria bacterium GW2011_GWE2_47_10]|nr:MAG: Peptidase M23 [Candidatus Moranbacteria bacterium GW2011_GWE2_47_10]
MFRHYSSHAVVVSSALLVAATNVTSGNVSGSTLFGYWDEGAEESRAATSNRIEAQESKREDLALVPLAKANTSIDPNMKDEEESEPIVQSQSILTSIAGSNVLKEPEEEGGVKLYTVKDGDTVSGIASKHGITINTILWANDIDNIDSIKPGDVIFILPVAGLNHVVASGDTIESIATKYKADKEKIIAFNDLPANGALETGKDIVIPGGQGESSYWDKEEVPDAGAIERRQYANSTGGVPEVSGWKDLTGKPGTGHRFPYGYCTWYVAQKRYVPWSGNAGTWLYKAKSMGYKTGKTPKVGSIVVTTEDRYYGHVAFVEKVSGGNITVSEMNYVGWAKTSRRSLPATSRVIKGFIY